MVAARLRIEGRRSPAPSTRPATLARTALITSAVRVPLRPFMRVSAPNVYRLPYQYSFVRLYGIVAGFATVEPDRWPRQGMR